MPTATAKQPEVVRIPPGYCPLAEALKILPVNDSTIERMVRDGRLRSGRIARDRRKPQRVYLIEDLERQAKEKKARETLRPRDLAAPRSSAKPDAIAALMALLERLLPQQQQLAAPAAPPAAPRLWLSLDEAAEFSGLAKCDLLDLCQANVLIARKSGGWKIQRKSLREFAG